MWEKTHFSLRIVERLQFCIFIYLHVVNAVVLVYIIGYYNYFFGLALNQPRTTIPISRADMIFTSLLHVSLYKKDESHKGSNYLFFTLPEHISDISPFYIKRSSFLMSTEALNTVL